MANLHVNRLRFQGIHNHVTTSWRLLRGRKQQQLRSLSLSTTTTQKHALECYLAKHPGVSSVVTPDCFGVRNYQPLSCPPGSFLCETTHLSVDPYMRCMLDPDHPQLGEYLSPFKLNHPVSGAGIGRVVISHDDSYSEGELVCLPFIGWPWQTRVVFNGVDVADLNLIKIPTEHSAFASAFLGTLGVPGLTAYFAVERAASALKKGGSSTVVVTAAAGAVGTVAGQLARIMTGARVVGICGSQDKCDALVNDLGFSVAINYKDESFAELLADEIGQSGVDVYLDNVGGYVSNLILPYMNQGGMVPIIGQIANYDSDIPYTTLVSKEGIPKDIAESLDEKGVERFRFLVLDYQQDWMRAIAEMQNWMQVGNLKLVETVWRGFAPGTAFCEMMHGGNFGKAVVEVDDTLETQSKASWKII